MRKNPRAYKFITAFMALVILSLCFSSLTAFAIENQKNDDYIDAAEFNGKRIGIEAGSLYVDRVSKLINDPEVYYFKNATDAAVAMETGKVDGIMTDEPMLRYYASQNNDVEVRRVQYKRDHYASAAGKTKRGRMLIGQYNEYLAELNKTGKLDRLTKKWVDGKDEGRVMDDYRNLPATNGEVIIASYVASAPFNYVKDNMIVGLEMEIMAGFCEAYGYRPVVKQVDLDGVIAGISTGKFDLASSGLLISDERKEAVTFADSFYASNVGIAFLKDSGFGKTSRSLKYLDVSDYAGKTIGVSTGTVYCDDVYEYIDDPQVKYYKTVADGAAAVQQGKIDAFLADDASTRYYASATDNVECGLIDSGRDQIATIASKTEAGDKLIGQYNEYLEKLKETGKLKSLENKWFSGKEDNRVIEDYSVLSGENGTVTIAISPDYPPFEYMKDDTYTGYEIELIMGFCSEYGYKPVLKKVDFDGIIAGLTAGKYDMGASAFTVTEERKNTVLFSDSIYECESGLIVPNEKKDSGVLSLTEITDGIKKTFITEARWKSFASGVYVTMKITLLSVIFGTILGFLVHIICRKGNKIAGKISAFARWLIQGMPEVVFLMIAYYIIFGKSSIGGDTVAIIVFTLVFACVTHNLMESGENGLDPGQKIAGTALGYSDMRIFIRIILPQIARGFMPAYLTAVSTHIKATAVVGYIAVVDITKVGDIVRGATYEAFYPLISVAILYFVMAGVLRLLIKLSTRNLNPELRSKEQILKGVTIND